MSYRDDKYDCLAAGRDEYVDSCALGICSEYERSRDKVSCIQAARGRVYSDDEIRDCKKRYDEGEGIECLAARGTSQARVQQLELSKERGYRRGHEDAQAETTTFDLAKAEQRGEAGGKAVGAEFVKRTAFNEGLAKGRAAKAPLDPAAYAEGEAEGSKIALAQATAFDHPSGFNAAFNEKVAGAATPALSETVSLQADQTASLQGTGTLNLTRVERMSVGAQPVAPQAAAVIPPSKQAPSDRDPGTYDLPHVGTKYPSTEGAPCIADDDTACIEAFKNGYNEGFTQAVHSDYTKQYREAYKTAFNNALAEVLAGVVPPEFAQEGVRFASRERGLLDNYPVSYAEFKVLEFDRGRASFTAALLKDPFVRLAGVRFSSAAGDGLVVPDNGFMIIVDIDNFGEVDATPGQFQLSLPEDEPAYPGQRRFIAQWAKTSRVLPKLPARTRSTFRFALEGTAGKMATTLPHVFTLCLDALAQDSEKQLSYRTIQSVTTRVVPNYPVELVSLVPNAKFSGTQAVSARFTVKNNNAVKSQALTAALVTSPKAVRIKNAEAVKIPELAPGETFEFEAGLEPTVWTNYKSPTDFSLDLSDGHGVLLARQLFPYVVDLGNPVGIRVAYKGTDYSGKTIQQPANYRSVPVQIQLDCSQKIELHDGYYFRYAGSSNPDFSFVGTVGADVGSCNPKRGRVVAHGSIWTPTKEVATPASLRFVLERHGTVIQGVQVFVKTVDGTARGYGGGHYGGCSSCR